MVFNVREAIGGFKHIGMGLERRIARRSQTFFLPAIESRGVRAQRFSSHDGTPAICSICGYAMIRLELPNGWLFDTCSAMPTVSALESQQFKAWTDSLSSEKLPTARV
jgi:hypothetical protein